MRLLCISQLKEEPLIKIFLLASSIFKEENLETRDFPSGASGKESVCQCKRCKRWSFDPGIGKIPWVGNGNPLWYSCPENPMERSLVGYRPWDLRDGHDKRLSVHTHTHTHKHGIKKFFKSYSQSVVDSDYQSKLSMYPSFRMKVSCLSACWVVGPWMLSQIFQQVLDWMFVLCWIRRCNS